MTFTVTDRFREEVRGSHLVASKVDVLDSGEVVATLDGFVVEGQVTEERADIGRRGDLQLVDEAGLFTPDEAADLLAPFGNELRPWRGVHYADGTEELVPLGTLVISSVEIDWPTIHVAGNDRGWLAQLARFTSPYQIAAGTNVVTAIEALLADRLPSYINFNLPATTETTPLLTFEQEGDPWQAATELATTLGMRLYLDRLGTVTMTAEASLTDSDPVATFAEGDDGVLLGLTRQLGTEDAFNGVVAYGENTTTGTPYRAEVWDTDPASPTYYLGKFGRRPRFHTSPFINSTDAAVNAARVVLGRELGLPEQVRFPLVVDPSLDVGDVVHVRRAVMAVDALHVLDSLTIPLRAAQPMEATTRSRQVLLP